jgi:hypothetical protein
LCGDGPAQPLKHPLKKRNLDRLIRLSNRLPDYWAILTQRKISEI